LRSLPKRFIPKVTVLHSLGTLNSLKLEELVWDLQTYEIDIVDTPFCYPLNSSKVSNTSLHHHLQTYVLTFLTVHPVRDSDLPYGRAIRLRPNDSPSNGLTNASEPHLTQSQLPKLGAAQRTFEGLWITFPTIFPVRDSDQRFAFGGRFSERA